MPVFRQSERSPIREAWGIAFLALALLMILSLLSYDWRDISLLKLPPNSPPRNLIGRAGAWFSFIAFVTLGIGAYVLPAWCLLLGLTLTSRSGSIRPARAGWALVSTLALACLLELKPNAWLHLRTQMNIWAPGGLLGQKLAKPLLWLLKDAGTAILASGVLLGGIVMLLGRDLVVNACRTTVAAATRIPQLIQALVQKRRRRQQLLEKRAREIEREQKRLAAAMRKEERLARVRETPNPDPLFSATPEPTPPKPTPPKPDPAQHQPLPEPQPPAATPTPAAVTPPSKPTAPPEDEPETEPAPPDFSRYELPPLDLLSTAPPQQDKEIKGDLQTTSRILKETLEEFGIETEIANIEQGPVVTRYELLPAPGVRVERIAALSNNLALNLKATSVRVQAPIPGKGVVGIEVPNSSSSFVFLKEVLAGERWRNSKAALPLVLGKDVGGNDIVADLNTMPHLLIAGATGSGKTVCMNSILAGLLMSRRPDELRLLLIDPKIVEFSVYNNLPHLVVPVVTDPKKVPLGLRWATNEMETRYKLFANAGVRNIAAYNSRTVTKQEELFPNHDESTDSPHADDPPDRLPYIVIVIDELADLMLVAQAEIEHCIARLAQLSRAVGIHMILATQRPSVNVITGTIKANFPARIAFQVAQKVDSRTILDAAGADKLLGRGDMLFLPPGSSKLVRAQGALTSDEEIRGITDFIRRQTEPHFEIAIKEKIESKTAALEPPQDDDMMEVAIEIIRETNKASTSSLQRRLRIGYTRAARIMDVLEDRGLVGPARGSEPREILVDLDNEIPDNRA